MNMDVELIGIVHFQITAVIQYLQVMMMLMMMMLLLLL